MKPDAEIYSIDANVILRYVLEDEPELFAKAYEILKAVEAGRTAVTCDPVNLAEVVWVLKSLYKLTNEQIYEGLQPILSPEGFTMPDKERYLMALKLFAGGVKDFGDACACAAALRDCKGRLYSFDKKLTNVPGIVRTEQPA